MADVAPADVHDLIAKGARLVDIRGAGEWATGIPEGAETIAMDALLETPSIHLPEKKEIVLLVCQRGLRSLLAAERLRQQGWPKVVSVAGGVDRWQAEGLPMRFGESAEFLQRYSRQIRLNAIGLAGQRRLRDSSVLLVGAGGLGSPVAFYLAAAGVGHICIVDDDVVDRSNLQRQILHAEGGIGQAKVESAATRLLSLNPQIRVETHPVRVDADNVDALVSPADVVIDGADNFEARRLLNSACIRHHRPLVYGAVQRFEGQASVFDAGRQRGVSPCYRCLFPEAPEDAPNCAEAGVLGVVPGVIGTLQATEALKLLLGIGAPLTGRLLRFDALSLRFRETRVPVDPACPACGIHAGTR